METNADDRTADRDLADCATDIATAATMLRCASVMLAEGYVEERVSPEMIRDAVRKMRAARARLDALIAEIWGRV